ncbi:MAG: cytochrome c3 family protein [Gemmatimonadota bacterium]
MSKSIAVAALAVTLLGIGLAVVRETSRTGAATAQPAATTTTQAATRDTGQSTAPPAIPGVEMTAEAAIAAHQSAGRGPEQPIPFNHRFHTTVLKMDCVYCHTGTERSVSGVTPPLDVCLGCHRVAGTGLDPIQELRGYGARNEPVPWAWVNRLPEFVQFNHQPHLRNGLACQECHGPVEEMDRVYKWAPLTMGWCLSCHRTEPKETDVATDYLLTRGSPREAGRKLQEKSFYPVAIDMKYGAYRAPIDCATCHY